MTDIVTPTSGITGGYRGDNANIVRAMTAFTAVAWYNSIELVVLVFVVFKRYAGLYFWSLLITSSSISVYALGAWMKMVQLTDVDLLSVTLSTVGWMVMVTGQSLVLWSRLHIVTQNERLLKAVLWMIVIDAVLLYIPTAVLTYGSNTSAAHSFLPAYAVVEKVQMTVFSVQEFIISGVYLWEVGKILRASPDMSTRKIMYELVVINVAIIILDIALLSVEFVDLYQIETTLKGMVYSIKLKLEFGVLSKLVKIITKKRNFPNEGVLTWETESHGTDLDRFRSTGPMSLSSVARKGPAKATTPAAEHTEFALGIGSADVKNSLSTNPGLIVPKPRQRSRRSSGESSITAMYPGRLT
ncbi:hypothetical protein LTR66_002644 [Elasticomyces elasticus]|nr:hypothetical protein LTR66_002644 [Elasticomyces elasticus]KAK5004212.1 hypothetical protein LTR28_009217 [Elasticomyces elasticus]